MTKRDKMIRTFATIDMIMLALKEAYGWNEQRKVPKRALVDLAVQYGRCFKLRKSEVEKILSTSLKDLLTKEK